MKYTLHLCMDKEYLIKTIRAYGAKEVLSDWDGTDDEAIARIEADPRQVFALDGCDDYDETGRCKGHQRP